MKKRGMEARGPVEVWWQPQELAELLTSSRLGAELLTSSRLRAELLWIFRLEVLVGGSCSPSLNQSTEAGGWASTSQLMLAGFPSQV